MRFAIIIVTYSSVKQTKRLVQRLNNGQFDFYIHVDKKIDINTHKELFDIPNVYFVKDRIDIKWAGYTTVQAALSSLRQLAASGKKYEFINLITGQDYPIKSAAYIADFLSKNVGKEFMHYKDFDAEWKTRVEKYHMTDMTFKGRYTVERLLGFAAPKRKFPLDIALYGKETFWTLSMEAALYVVNLIDSNPKLGKFLKYTWGSDEFVFQSLLMSSPFKDRIVNKNYRYINWPEVGARPNVFVAADFERIMASDALFGRKFDVNVDEKIFDLIDNATDA